MTATASSGYVAISRRTLDLEDYIDVARRHAAWILGPVFAGLVISTVVAFLVPNTYVSEADDADHARADLREHREDHHQPGS